MPNNPNGNQFRTLLHMVHSSEHASAGLIPQAEKHRDHAHDYFKAHISDLTNAHKHDEAKSFTDHITPYFKKLDAIIDYAKARKANAKPKLIKAEELEKGLVSPAQAATAQSIGYRKLDTNKGSGYAQVNRNPGQDSRYDYKPLHELSHGDQIKASHSFSGKDMQNHHYAVDKKTGAFEAGASRWLQSKSNAAPQATSQDQGSMIAPQHRAGAAIRIHDETHPMHGSLGIVKAPNPNVPGKIPVQVGPAAHQVEYMDPHQVRMSSAPTRDNSKMADLAERGRVVLKSIRSDLS